MLNAPHLLETALLMLAAFLLGAVTGLALRFVFARPKAAVARAAKAVPAATPAPVPDLVKAPEIAPIARPSVAERIAAAAAGKSAAEPAAQATVEPASPSMQPARIAGETVAGRHIDNPEHSRPATLEDVRAEIEARINAEPLAEDPAPVVPADVVATARAEIIAAIAEPHHPEDAAIVPAAVAEPKLALPEATDALAAEAQTPILADVTEEEAEEELPVEQRVEPALADQPMTLMDPPRELAAEIQEVIETPDTVPDVVAEAPLVEPAFEKEEAEAAADRLFPLEDESQLAPSREAEDELAAMRAIEGGWTPRSPASRPADLPEGVVADAAATDRAVVESGNAVASAAAAVSAVLEDAAPTVSKDSEPAQVTRLAGGFGRPAGLPAPRDGAKDDLGQIKGLGPAIESALNGLGIYHFDQIADWDQKAVVWIENHFGFRGRIARERWQEQARDLSQGRMPVARPMRR